MFVIVAIVYASLCEVYILKKKLWWSTIGHAGDQGTAVEY